MGWSEWKDFGGESGGITRKGVGQVTGNGTSNVSAMGSFDITSITDKYAEFTSSNFFVELSYLESEAEITSFAQTTKDYNPETGQLLVRMVFKNTGGSSIRLRANVYLVY